MSPRQSIVVENSALRRFLKKHGYCIRAVWLAETVEAELRKQGLLNEQNCGLIFCAGLRVSVKRRGDQWFVTDIEKGEEGDV